MDGNYLEILYQLHYKNPPKNNTEIGLPHSSLHHGHVSLKRKVFEDGLRYSSRRRGQDAEFIRNVLDKYASWGDKNINYIDAPLTIYNRRIIISNNINNKVKDVIKNSYVITLNTNDLGYEKSNLIDKRIFELEEIFQYYELPYRLFYGTYFDGKGGRRSNNDLREIKKNYPYIETSKLKQNGEIGILGSFFKLLESTIKSVDKYLMMYEDDSRPVGPKQEFWEKFGKSINSMPQTEKRYNPSIYNFSYTNYCRNKCPHTNKWVGGYKKKTAGAHSILFTKDAIEKILKHAKKYKVSVALDNYIHYLHDIGVIKLWTWEGEPSNNGMFCGLFTQSETYCDTRNAIINHKEGFL